MWHFPYFSSMKKLLLLFGICLFFSCSKDSSEDSFENEVETLLIDIEQIKGKWNLSGNGQSSKGGSACDIYSVIFTQNSKTSGNFKLYITGRAIKGEFVIGPDSIKLSVSDNEIGVITQLSVQGDNLSASFNIQGYCVAKVQSEKDEEHQPGMVYIPDDRFIEAILRWDPNNIGRTEINPLTGYKRDNIAKGNYIPKGYTSRVNRPPISLNISNAGITDLTGIEEFTELHELWAQFNDIEYFDFTNHPMLVRAYLTYNKIKSVDLTNNRHLIDLLMQGNPIDMDVLDLSNNIKLKNIWIGGFDDNYFNPYFNRYGSKKKWADIRFKPEHYGVDLDNSIESQSDYIDFNNLELELFMGRIGTVKYPKTPDGLLWLDDLKGIFSHNKIESIASISDKDNLGDIRSLNISWGWSEIEELDLSPFENLENLTLENVHSLKSIDLRNSKKLKRVAISYCNDLSEIQLDGLESLYYLELRALPKLKSTDLSNAKVNRFWFFEPQGGTNYNGEFLDYTPDFNYSDYDAIECVLINESQSNCIYGVLDNSVDCWTERSLYAGRMFTTYSELNITPDTYPKYDLPSSEDCGCDFLIMRNGDNSGGKGLMEDMITPIRINPPNVDLFKTSCD